ncbi:hypothetical protein UCRPA7_5163 [Phaeoacremonium minimum UCRPA7]|uniref:J domain-containing protein n=1 Tax=Phaeoacremonium minimum (strain UCR-PA7) TaxID=1286976 RepID=R8BIY8_PHAM7|nr:hypothetical protein UCRPA7_5163 [Phaeoacremonium minimum UCRPA7]EON99285.1 hypothetical protein UCRPA7_5163 [Phaeoacremonium minimum UCRPA7]
MSWAQTIYYGISIRAGDPRPQPGTPRWAEHRRRIHILVVSLYLLYTIYEADWELRRAGDFYSALGVSPSASDRDIKTRFRRLAALHHPDKTTMNAASAEQAAQDNAFFLKLKTASETLLDPARRFAYDRFGPEVVGWTHCTTIRDYVARGARVNMPYYGAVALLMYGLSLVGYMSWGQYERWLVLVVVFAFELHAMTRPTGPALFASFINPFLSHFTSHPPYLPFQAISMARKVSVALSIAFSQIGPMLSADTSRGQVSVQSGTDSEALVKQGLDRLELTARGLDSDAMRLLELEMAPFAGDPALMNSMRGKLKEWLVQNTIRNDPMVRDAVGRSFQKRRVDAPAGARGNR